MLASRAMLAFLASDAVLTPVQAFVLGAVQGITELLPISSSAHLYLVPTVLGWPYVGVAFDVAMHAGTLLALVVAFLDDWLRMFRDGFTSDPTRRSEARQLCTGDALRLCSSEIPNIPAITACMFKNKANLSTGCRTLMNRELAAQRAS